MNELAPQTPNYLRTFTLRRWIGGCLALASVVAIVDSVTTDSGEPQPAACYYEVPADGRTWNVAADLAGTEFPVQKVTDALSRDNPAALADHTAAAGEVIIISDPAVCNANQLPLRESE